MFRLLLHGSMLSISSEVEEKWYTAIIIGRDFAERCVKHDRLKICTVNDENGSLKSLISETRWSEWGDSNSRHLEPKGICRILSTSLAPYRTVLYINSWYIELISPLITAVFSLVVVKTVVKNRFLRFVATTTPNPESGFD